MIVENLKKYIDSKGISMAEFERSIGMSNNSFRKSFNNNGNIGSDKLENILRIYPDIDFTWLLTGKGDMIKKDKSYNTIIQESLKEETRPRIPYNALAGSLTSAIDGVTIDNCEKIPVIQVFPSYDFTIRITGNSMSPYYESGDEVACKKLNESRFIQWGRPHVLDTTQGVVIKKIYDNGEGIKCISYNPDFPDFSVPKDEIYSISLVVGSFRL